MVPSKDEGGRRPANPERQRRGELLPKHPLADAPGSPKISPRGLRLPQFFLLAWTKHQLNQLQHRVVKLVHHALLERDDGIVRDRDVLGADLRAALGDVAVAN